MQKLCSLGVTLIALAASSSLALHAQPVAATNAVQVFDRATNITPLPNGVAIEDGPLREEITALRDNIIRIRIGRNGTMPEDASWAVFSEARHSTVQVTPENAADSFGFRTGAVAVQIERNSLRLTIRDLSGKIVQQDALPVRFDGSSFSIYKTMPLDEHYFGLGDKIGRAHV